MDEYNTLNGLLAESLGSGIAAAESYPKAGNDEDVKMEDGEEKTITDDEGEKDQDDVEMKVDSDEEANELKRVINSTLEFVNQHDKKELKELFAEI